MTETITVSAGGAPFRLWRRLEVEASIKDAARSFSLDAALPLGGGATAAQLFPSSSVVIGIPGLLLFTGTVDRYQPTLKAREVSAKAAGRAKGADAVDSSADHTKPDYVGRTILDIAKDQDAFGIGFSADFPMTAIDRTRPNVGESLFEFLCAHLDPERATMAGQGDGSIKLTRAGVSPPRQPGTIVEGINFFEGTADHDSSRRHSEIHVHGQGYKGSGTSALQMHAVATDPAVGRHRPLHIVHPGHTDAARVANRATNHRDAAAGEGTRLPYRASTWRDSAGAVYLPGNLIWTEVPTLSLVQDMLIERVRYVADKDEGEHAELDLVDPRAHGGQGGGVNKSGSVWS